MKERERHEYISALDDGGNYALVGEYLVVQEERG
jgi:hypothetical protein